MTSAWQHVVWKMFCRDTHTGPEFIGVHTLNFKPNFKFSRLELFGGDPYPTSDERYELLVNLIARVKFSGSSTPYGLKYSLPKSAF